MVTQIVSHLVSLFARYHFCLFLIYTFYTFNKSTRYCLVQSSPDCRGGGRGEKKIYISPFRYLCWKEGGRQPAVDRAKNTEREESFIAFTWFFFLSLLEACVLDRRECLRGRLMEKDGEGRRRAWSGGWGGVKLKKSERKFEKKMSFTRKKQWMDWENMTGDKRWMKRWKPDS